MAASGDGVSLDALNKLIAQWGTLVAGLGALAAGNRCDLDAPDVV